MFYCLIIFQLITFEKCFLFSVVIAIYNAGRYLNDSIGSLITQTIDYKNIEIILVNDGSTDNTEENCLKYQNNYIKNIIYIKIKHNGVSKARNVGMNYANGKYINFLDADDKWDNQAFKFFLSFFEKYGDVDFAAGRIKFFEARQGYHPLDYKFYVTRRVNLTQDYKSIQLSASSSVFKKSSLEGKQFPENVNFCEDARFVNIILLHKPIIGLIKEAIYYYRRRNDFSSAINNQKNNLEFYFGTLYNVYDYLISISKTLYNKILPFIQFLIIYDIFWRIQSYAFYYLDSNNFEKYKQKIESLLIQIDDKYFYEQKVLSTKFKVFILSKKYQKDLRYDIELKNNFFIYSNCVLINLEIEKNIINWRTLNIKNNILYLESIDNLWLPKGNYQYYCNFGNNTYFPKYIENQNYDFYTMFGLTQKGRTIIFEIPLEIDEEQILYTFISYKNISSEIFTSLGLYSHIPPISNGYFVNGNYIIKYNGNRIVVDRYNIEKEKNLEKQYCNELTKYKKDYIIELRNHIKNKSKENYEIWIINDKRDKAGDNGEYFFRYLSLKNPKGIKFFFAIENNCEDYKRLEKFGNILNINSDEYRKAFLESNKIISSISDDWVDNPFYDDRKYLRDLFHFDFIFLKNGIIIDDLSRSLNKFNKNYSLVITSSKKEYESFLSFKYGYDQKNIILTGMPRYDNQISLKDKEQKQKKIIIIPTWRTSINENRNLIIYNDKDKYTKFSIFYDNLINDKRLLSTMKYYNYTGVFCVHHSLESEIQNFSQNEIFSVLNHCDYSLQILEASLLVTDYSNLFFDFGYMKKPVIYTHFDQEEYNNSRFQNEFFDYDKDGFGPICKDVDCTINEIISEVRINCILKKFYFKRIKKFFKFFDQNNNERIFIAIKQYNKTVAENTYHCVNYVFLICVFLAVINYFKKLVKIGVFIVILVLKISREFTRLRRHLNRNSIICEV